jgi:DNA-binding MurR/RpiR family transcriptional regulator
MVLEKIRQVYPQLTKSQKRLADHITNHYRDAAFMTASQLAQKLDLNEATVIRFAQRLGYSGYPDLIQHVRDLVHQELVPPAPAAPEVEDLMRALLFTELDGAQRFVSHLSSTLAQEVVTRIRQAERVYVIGQGVAAPLAQLLSYTLRYMGIPAVSPPSDPSGLAMIVDELTPAAILIGISAWDEGEEVANTMRLAARKEVPTVAITCSGISPAALAADTALTCPLAEQLPVRSITGVAILIDALIQTLAAQDPDRLSSHRAAVEQAQDYIAGNRRR